ncbi:hypothetical protein GCM10011534_34140 [Pseudooceanicola nanhaiensis]|uniref:Uncharacterized protein n=1 Tax=Pseudooceanicola nanhaiensis TaxID=375761 RepID=A0A917T5X8_9RHOB|nr:hypothetical protein GCM10011534_34140 [Pseudooceanicola nanhaiensis]
MPAGWLPSAPGSREGARAAWLARNGPEWPAWGEDRLPHRGTVGALHADGPADKPTLKIHSGDYPAALRRDSGAARGSLRERGPPTCQDDFGAADATGKEGEVW